MTRIFTNKNSPWLIVGFGILVTVLILRPLMSDGGRHVDVIFSDDAICKYSATHPEAYRLDRNRLVGLRALFATIKENRDRIRPVPRIANEPPSSTEGFRVATVTDDSTLTVFDKVGTADEGRTSLEYTFHHNGDIDIRTASRTETGERESIASVHGKTGLIICELTGTRTGEEPNQSLANPVGFTISQEGKLCVSRTGFDSRGVMLPFDECDSLLRQITEKLR